MEFVYNFYVYGVNDDNTITLYVFTEDGTKVYFRVRAHYSALASFGNFQESKGFTSPMISGTFKISYVRGVGLVLTLLGYKIIEDDLGDLPVI